MWMTGNIRWQQLASQPYRICVKELSRIALSRWSFVHPSGGFDQFNSEVAVADMNSDGRPDIVVMNGCSVPCQPNFPPQGSVSILLSMSNGTFSPAVSYASGNYFANSLAVADLNGDGRADVAVAQACTASPFKCLHCESQRPEGRESA
jgi:hypothetical protein